MQDLLWVRMLDCKNASFLVCLSCSWWNWKFCWNKTKRVSLKIKWTLNHQQLADRQSDYYSFIRFIKWTFPAAFILSGSHSWRIGALSCSSVSRPEEGVFRPLLWSAVHAVPAVGLISSLVGSWSVGGNFHSSHPRPKAMKMFGSHRNEIFKCPSLYFSVVLCLQPEQKERKADSVDWEGGEML